ncbi:hypothetical protein SESBI_14883 [Sesbania bispinosa]|nr:hypothetical protein SESBI_14883 [Sesbania bispinosa]
MGCSIVHDPLNWLKGGIGKQDNHEIVANFGRVARIFTVLTDDSLAIERYSVIERSPLVSTEHGGKSGINEADNSMDNQLILTDPVNIICVDNCGGCSSVLGRTRKATIDIAFEFIANK